MLYDKCIFLNEGLFSKKVLKDEFYDQSITILETYYKSLIEKYYETILEPGVGLKKYNTIESINDIKKFISTFKNKSVLELSLTIYVGGELDDIHNKLKLVQNITKKLGFKLKKLNNLEFEGISDKFDYIERLTLKMDDGEYDDGYFKIKIKPKKLYKEV